MRYRIAGFEVRSENTAKPAAQASSVLTEWLQQNPPNGQVLDFGCGKLRYAPLLARTADRLTLVDSEEQLTREQTIRGSACSISSFAQKEWHHVRVLTTQEFQRDRTRYDFVLCSNVLSAIPCRATRGSILESIADRLKSKGRCLSTTQYRNSDFRKMAKLPNSRPHLDGWILVKGDAAFYYGIIPLPKLLALLRRHGHAVVWSWRDGESAYALTRTRRGS